MAFLFLASLLSLRSFLFGAIELDTKIVSKRRCRNTPARGDGVVELRQGVIVFKREVGDLHLKYWKYG
ncbi:hypothetical protein E2C01_053195 [Portunus trituberculatus]|uniref:Secreted protein n=1 Tax=Portunus trituberculatus TaxID=210409 RepID=A0A5B7GNI4_PORTR|nr:hypothetical protein [Portunus trituberculatus]